MEFSRVTTMKSNEAVGQLATALRENDYPTSYLSELTRFIGIEPASAEPLTTIQQNLLQCMVFSLKQQAPVEYLVGEAVFYERRFFVNRDVLIPRFDTEKLVTQALGLAQTLQAPITFIDIGTGSGAIIISLAKELENRNDVSFWATDISPATLAVARKNAKKHVVEKQINFRISDVYPRTPDNSPDIPKTKHVILVSNPPYISEKYFEKLPISVKNYEPSLALKEQPNFLEKITTYLNCLRHKGITTDLFLEYNNNSGIAQFQHFDGSSTEIAI